MPYSKMTQMTGWGRYPSVQGEEIRPDTLDALPLALSLPYSPRGSGRSYGDAGIPAAGHCAVSTLGLGRILAFDQGTGLLEAEAGATLDSIVRIALPLGYFLPVTPGTLAVTLGGALASNVHGKNHHITGSIENYVDSLEVATPKGTFTCSAKENSSLFRATVGGYGSTGFIRKAAIRLKPVVSAEMDTVRFRARGLDDMFRLFSEHDSAYEYSVAWLDALTTGSTMGRGVLMLGNHASTKGKGLLSPPSRSRKRVSFPLPGFALNRGAIAAFNAAYWRFATRQAVLRRRQQYSAFLHPLDGVGAYNQFYPRRGFLEYQFCIPHDPVVSGRAEQSIADFLRLLSDRRLGVFLSVLKRCGDDSALLPFCRRGYTLAIDVPMRGEETLRALDRLDEFVISRRGRVYLTKDARLKPDAYRAMYPEHEAFIAEVRRWNPDGLSRSGQAQRLRWWV